VKACCCPTSRLSKNVALRRVRVLDAYEEEGGFAAPLVVDATGEESQAPVAPVRREIRGIPVGYEPGDWDPYFDSVE